MPRADPKVTFPHAEYPNTTVWLPRSQKLPTRAARANESTSEARMMRAHISSMERAETCSRLDRRACAAGTLKIAASATRSSNPHAQAAALASPARQSAARAAHCRPSRTACPRTRAHTDHGEHSFPAARLSPIPVPDAGSTSTSQHPCLTPSLAHPNSSVHSDTFLLEKSLHFGWL